MFYICDVLYVHGFLCFRCSYICIHRRFERRSPSSYRRSRTRSLLPCLEAAKRHKSYQLLRTCGPQYVCINKSITRKKGGESPPIDIIYIYTPIYLYGFGGVRDYARLSRNCLLVILHLYKLTSDLFYFRQLEM